MSSQRHLETPNTARLALEPRCRKLLLAKLMLDQKTATDTSMEASAVACQAAPAATTQRRRPAGRTKVPIKQIKCVKGRSVTFLKRKKGLMKKATELSVLCSSDVALIVFSPHGKLFVYSNTSVEEVYERCTNHRGRVQVKFFRHVQKQRNLFKPL
eukprot:1612094-Pleurochrysis_carterae.AAC.1